MNPLRMILKIIERIITFIIGGDEKKLYGLDHAILNIEAPPKNMWMNMGYWRHTKSFHEACEALLDQVLTTAGLLNEDRTPTPSTGGIKLVDVGIGCGDQSLYLTRRLSKSTHTTSTPNLSTGVENAATAADSKMRRRTSSGTQAQVQEKPLFDSYVGVTLAQSQADFARERLQNSATTTTADSDPDPDSLKWTPDVQIYAADAANPTSWGPELKKSVSGHRDNKEDQKNETQTQTWLLALDTLYHFKPSRTPLLKHAHDNMNASFMAFDLLLSSTPSLWNSLRMRIICLVTGIPFSNFVNREEYVDMLVRAGYAREMIEMRDVSEYVFGGIAGYIRDKEVELGRVGMSVGKFKAAATAFSWWASSGVVRGFVVVAHRS